MGYLGASVAVLAAAMAFPSTAFGQTAEPTPQVKAGGVAPCPPDQCLVFGTMAYIQDPRIKRYTTTLLYAFNEYHVDPCYEVSPGIWTVTTNPKYGEVSIVTVSGPLLDGACPGNFTFSAIYYTWTAHNNKDILGLKINGKSYLGDELRMTWKSPDLPPAPLGLTMLVKTVRPVGETTEFVAWQTPNRPNGEWKQKLKPPNTDPSFNFSGEKVQEFAAAPAGPDNCWFMGSLRPHPFVKITGGTWTVGELRTELGTTMAGKKVWGVDGVGYGTRLVAWYRLNSPTNSPLKGTGSCGTKFGQQMKIKALSDADYNDYEAVNVLGASMTATTVTSIRAGKSEMKTWP